MKVPEPRKLSSGKWFIQLRLDGESITVSDFSKKECIKQAQYIKAEYLAGKRSAKADSSAEKQIITLSSAIDDFCKSNSNTLSPATIRGYQNIRKSQMQEIMGENIFDIAKLTEEEWQNIVNREAGKYSPKTVKNSVSLVRQIIKLKTKKSLPEVKLPAKVSPDTAFLHADEIPTFVSAVMETDIAVPALLALSSMRLSEIQALNWEDIDEKPDFIHTNGAVVPNENHKLVHKKQNKNITSSRDVPILIPELKQAIERDRKPSGPVLAFSQVHFLRKLHRICKKANITDVTVHGLRHSFASLAYYLNVPQKIAMEIGGWSDPDTMQKIYTHIAKKDITRYQTAIADFYSKKSEE